MTDTKGSTVSDLLAALDAALVDSCLALCNAQNAFNDASSDLIDLRNARAALRNARATLRNARIAVYDALHY